jgi:cellulose synthase/poly-beta-1,6-N-acetylglucosamine synthase-like glycosyltransferase
MLANLLIGLLALCIVVLFVGEAGVLRSLLAGFSYLRRLRHRGSVRFDANTILKSPLVPSVSVLVALPDASPACRQSVHDLVKLHYGDHEVLAVLDGPTQDELALWIQEFRLFRSSRGASGDIPTGKVVAVYESGEPYRLMVLECEKAGPVSCLNAALNVACAQLIGVADPRSLISPDTLIRVVMPFLEKPATTVAACVGVPPPGGETYPARFRTLECVRLWLGRAAGLASRGAALPPPGAFLLFDRGALREANGFATSAFEMIFHLHALNRLARRQYGVEWAPQDVVTPLSPTTLSELRRVTCADQLEVRRTVKRHFPVLGSLDALGRIAMPGLIVASMVRPVAETVGLAAAAFGLLQGLVEWRLAGLLILVSCVFGTFNSMLAVLLREYVEELERDPAELLRLFLAAIPENFGYRQLRNLWLIGGLFER